MSSVLFGYSSSGYSVAQRIPVGEFTKYAPIAALSEPRNTPQLYKYEEKKTWEECCKAPNMLADEMCSVNYLSFFLLGLS